MATAGWAGGPGAAAELCCGPQERPRVLGIPGRVSDHDPRVQARQLIAGQVAPHDVARGDLAQGGRGRGAGFQQNPAPLLPVAGRGFQQRRRAEQRDRVTGLAELNAADAQCFYRGRAEPPVVVERVRPCKDVVLIVAFTAGSGRPGIGVEPRCGGGVDQALDGEAVKSCGGLAGVDTWQVDEQFAEAGAMGGGVGDQHFDDRPVGFRGGVHHRRPGRSVISVTGRCRSASVNRASISARPRIGGL